MNRCKYCNHCRQIGKMNDQKFHIGRKKYYCEHPDISNMKDKHGYFRTGFVGFGESSVDSPLALKTSPRWCPLRQPKAELSEAEKKRLDNLISATNRSLFLKYK